MKIVHDSHVAEELAQEAYIRALRALETTPIEHLEAFLHRTVRNLAIDHERRRKRRGNVEMFDVPHAVLDTVPDSSPTAEASMIEREQMRMFERALAELPERTRVILAMSRIEGLTHSEIAERLGISTSTVFNELKRGILRCRASLEDAGRT